MTIWKEDDMRLLALIILILSMCLFSEAYGVLDPHELPLGSTGLALHYVTSQLDTLGQLGFNYFHEYPCVLNTARIESLSIRGMQVARGGRDYYVNYYREPEAPFKYSISNYAIIEVNPINPNPEVRMVKFGGNYEDSLWVSSQNSRDTLSGISTYGPEFQNESFQNRVAFMAKYSYDYNGDTTKIIRYYIRLHAKINNPDSSSEPVAEVNVRLGQRDGSWLFPPCFYNDTTFIVSPDSFHEDNLQNIELGFFTIPDSIPIKQNCGDSIYTYFQVGDKGCVPYLNIQIITTGEMEFAIDKIIIYDPAGLELYERGTYDNQILQKFSDYYSYRDKIFAWALYDEPMYSNFLPFKHIKDLMHSICSDWTIYTYNWLYDPHETQIRSWLRIVDEDYACPDIYTIAAGENNYYGDYYQNTEGWPGGGLYMLNRNISWVRDEVDAEGKDFWIALQAHKDLPNNPSFRQPTTSELSCETFMALAWGAKGLNYYFYYWPGFCNGILSTSGEPTPLYYELKDNIAPYIQAIGEFYMRLEWQRSYVYHSSNPQYLPPLNSVVSSISSVSEPCTGVLDETEQCYNPDLGWYQVGEFNGPSGDYAKYVLLVNRACNDNLENVAPPVKATVHFNVNNLNLGNYVLITDLADTVVDSSGQWIGVPRTTYSGVMPDGKIPYSITLKAGEGKLIKIATANN
jgi:hypothetical protein